MKFNRFLAIAAMVSMTAFALSCNKTNPDTNPDPDPDPEPEVDVINGTTIDEGTTACGLITNSKTGTGIAGIPVTDGYTYTVTDANGVYQMEANRYCRKIYMSVPAEYEIPLDPATHLPLFYSSTNYVKGKVNRFDFSLTPLTTSEDNFTLVMIGDPQCQTTAQIARYTSETVPDMLSTLNSKSSTYPHAYGMTLGDIVFDSTELWDGMKSSMSNLKLNDGTYLPIFQCIGNHDHNSLVSSGDYEATAKYVEKFGPTDYSFDRGQVHIVVMDNIMVTSRESNSSPNRYTWDYDGGFTKSQYTWLQADLAQVKDKENKIIFLCCHIPFRAGTTSGGASMNKTAYYAETLTLLKSFKDAHIMIGHTHYPQNYIHTGYICKSGRPVYEHVHGAACGAWWNCNSNVSGAPNGYSLYQITGNTVKNWVAKGTKKSEDYQMRVYDGNQTYTGTKGYVYNWYNASNVGGSSNITAKGYSALKNCFVAEVWDDDDRNWKVEMYQNGAKLANFTRVPNGSCCNICITSYYFNQLGKNTSTWASSTASHYWYYKPASGDPTKEQNWEVRATQTIPDSGVVNNYACATLTTGYDEF